MLFRSPLRSHSHQTPSFPWMKLPLITFVRMHMKHSNANAVHHMASERKQKEALGGISSREIHVCKHTLKKYSARQSIAYRFVFNVASWFYYISQLINEWCRQLIMNSAEITCFDSAVDESIISSDRFQLLARFFSLSDTYHGHLIKHLLKQNSLFWPRQLSYLNVASGGKRWNHLKGTLKAFSQSLARRVHLETLCSDYFWYQKCSI